MNSLRGGMQVHAVPDAERAFDASGRQLPWGYEYADSELAQRRVPEERGPFGRSTRRRGHSRSRTATTPSRPQDQAKLENQKVEDDIFSKHLGSIRAQATTREQSVPVAASLSSIEANTVSNPQAPSTKEPTEVILYGYGLDAQWAAIEYYERISNGSIYEDYDRHPPQQRYDHSLSFSRAAAQRSMSKAALRKKNQYVGGDHWIKVTFDSPEAADLACHDSPHTIHGYLVYAEPYRGTGPNADAPIPASQAGARIDSTSLPRSFSTHTFGGNILNAGGSPTSSDTASSVTATGASYPTLPRSTTLPNFGSTKAASFNHSHPPTTTSASDLALQQKQPTTPAASLAPLRVPGAKRAVLLPAEQALLPSAPKWQQTFSSWPILGVLLTGGGDVIGTMVPRLEDGSFDWKSASLYWRFWYWVDSKIGTDFCGMRGDD
ncbi:hypothetical protein B0A49_07767 [Cryomyces minteri]|uniref:Nucleoporin NUP53 n=1 Tax=Cryomyces minteri TaxID=331657 RepID=A0A4U0X5P7_9PEZI|nr:hypothetical protein B0A49_07767 [Cryomyces minteri]